MLASFLPGLREVRTPLTVGYLWLLCIWLTWADKIPTERPAGDNVVTRWFDVSGMLGPAGTLAVLSFLAYAVGALARIPTAGRLVGGALRSLGAAWNQLLGDKTYEATKVEFESFLRNEIEKVRDRVHAVLTQWDHYEVDADLQYIASGEMAPLIELRPRLLVTNQEVYGEYDRLAAEGDFRINLFPPIIALAIIVGFSFGVSIGVPLACGLLLLAVVLLIQGTNRLRSSDVILMRAVLEGVVEHGVSVRAREVLDTYDPEDPE
jgi:hypothetical protein